MSIKEMDGGRGEGEKQQGTHIWKLSAFEREEMSGKVILQTKIEWNG